MFLAKVLQDGQWRAGIGDPSVMGWLIVGLYIVCLLACLRCLQGRRVLIEPAHARRYGLFWLALSVVVFILAVNKQLDLQSLMHVAGRNLAIRQGWFDDRRVVQRWFLVGVGGAGVLSVGVMLLLMRGLWARVWLAAVGVAVLVGFILMRAVSFHGMDQVLRLRLWGNVYANHAMEMAGILLLTAGAVSNLLRIKTDPSPVSHTAR